MNPILRLGVVFVLGAVTLAVVWAAPGLAWVRYAGRHF